jgi:hypothetical protein
MKVLKVRTILTTMSTNVVDSEIFSTDPITAFQVISDPDPNSNLN